jgi:branched-subunit amino acid aminotransferase/4-amino-4-deoxychorismate lyase
LLNTNGEVAEGASANLFWIRGPVVYTAPTAVGMLPGVTRAVILELCAQQGITVKKRLIRGEQLRNADALFFTNSAHGVVEGHLLDDFTFPGSPLVAQLRRGYVDMVQRECSAGQPANQAVTAS